MGITRIGPSKYGGKELGKRVSAEGAPAKELQDVEFGRAKNAIEWHCNVLQFIESTWVAH